MINNSNNLYQPLKKQYSNCPIQIILNPDFSFRLPSNMLSPKHSQHKMQISSNSVNYGRIQPETLYDLSPKKMVKSSRTSTPGTGEAADSPNFTFKQFSVIRKSLPGKPYPQKYYRYKDHFPYQIENIVHLIFSFLFNN